MEDIALTGSDIVQGVKGNVKAKALSVVQGTTPRNKATPLMGNLAKAYLHIYTNQRRLLQADRDFYGMRDYYAMLKMLRSEIGTETIQPILLARAVGRNFGGRLEAKC